MWSKKRWLTRFFSCTLESLTFHPMSLDGSNFAAFVEQCSRSRKKHHILSFPDVDRTSHGFLQAQLQELAREEGTLFAIEINPPLGLFSQLGLLDLRPNLSGTTLQHLSLTLLGMDYGTCKLLTIGLASNSSLVTLNVYFINFAASWLLPLAEAISSNAVLLSLGLTAEHTVVGYGKDMMKFAKALSSNTTLDTLVLHGIGEDFDAEEEVETSGGLAGVAFAYLLKVNRSLRWLDISHCRIGRVGCGFILDALDQNESLIAFGLSLCGMGKDELERLSERTTSIENHVNYHIGKVLWTRFTLSAETITDNHMK